MNYSVVGFYNKNNSGDDAFTLAIPRLLPQGSEISFTHGPPSKDAVAILGGGDVIGPYFFNFIPDGREFYVLGAGVSYEPELENLKKLRVKEAFFRNKKDAQLANDLGIKSFYTPDLVFSLDVPQTKRILPKGDKKLLGIMYADSLNEGRGSNFRSAAYGKFFKWELADLIFSLKDYYRPVFIPMSHKVYDMDTRSLMDIINFLPEFVDHDLLPPLPPMDIIKAVSELDLLLTVRFHGLIYATLAGTPFVNIGLSRKTQQYCLENDLTEYCVPKYSFFKDRCLEHIKNAEAPGVSAKLRAITDKNKQELVKVQEHIRSWT